MTNQKRAEKILELVYNRIDNDGEWDRRSLSVDEVISHLDEAQLEVLEQNEVLVKIRIDEAAREAVDQGPTVLQACQASYREGYAAAREQAAGIVRESGIGSTINELAERIRAMEADK